MKALIHSNFAGNARAAYLKKALQKKMVLFAICTLISSLVFGQDLLTKNTAGYIVNFGKPVITNFKVMEDKPLALILFDMTPLATAKTRLDTANAWKKMLADRKYYFAVAGTAKPINASSFQFVTKEQFLIDFAGRQLSLFVFSNPGNVPGNTIVPTSINQGKDCCEETCVGLKNFYETLTKCLGGKGTCKTCVNCCFPIMSTR